MIAPRRTTLVRVPDLAAFQHAIAVRAGGSAACVVIVPTQAAADETKLKLRPTVGTSPMERGFSVVEEVVTRDGWYDVMSAALADAPRRLTDLEREVMLSAAIREVIAAGIRPPFKIRPGLVPEILAFYDALRRLNRGVDTFERLMTDDLAPASDADRGAARLLIQTTFLAAACRGYERRLTQSAAVDEHALRQRLLGADVSSATRHVIVTVGDRLCDPPGLWPADFDLLTRLDGIARIDVIATDQVLSAGFQRRIEELLPGLEQEEIDEEIGTASSGPLLVASERQPDALHHVHRDREEELRASARRIKERARLATPLNRIAIVIRRPLPYVYLAASIFKEAGLPLQTAATLPLAAEPFAAALHLVFDCVMSRFTRSALVGLIRSPHFRFVDEEGELDRQSTATLNRSLADAGYLGDLAHLARLAEQSRASRLAHRIAAELEPLASNDRASILLDRLLKFLTVFQTPLDPGDPLADRLARGRASVLDSIRSLRDAYGSQDDPVVRFEDLAATIKRRIEEQTFALPSDPEGVHLIDAETAAYGTFDEVHLAGLVEGEWPNRTRPSIFYPATLLHPLGWPAERERVHAIRAGFRDLLALARQRVLVSTFTLDGDDIVEPSTLIEQLEPYRHRSESVTREPEIPQPVSLEEALDGATPAAPDSSETQAWLTLRRSRTTATDSRYHGEAGAQPARPYAVTAIDLYLDCPFKYFATHVLKLQEDPEDEETMSQKSRGRFIHEVFRAFFERWQAAGEGAITVDTIDRARSSFREVVEEQLASLGPAEANLERTRLLGSPVAAGLGERVFRMEAERPIPIVERLLEFRLDGEFDIGGEGARRVRLAGTADRIDLLADGSLRLIDYKIGWGPQAGRAIQLPIYAVMATQRLAGRRGRSWTPAEAGYLAFGRQEFAPVGETPADLAEEMAEGQARLLMTIDAIERGSFPPQPAEPFFCGTCVYASVCRKDYVELET